MDTYGSGQTKNQCHICISKTSHRKRRYGSFLDTGISMHPDLQGRILAFRDFINPPRGGGREKISVRRQWARHTCAGICCGSGQLSRGQYAGMAPGAGIVSAKVLDYHGNGMREQVLSSVSWILKNKNRYHIKNFKCFRRCGEQPGGKECRTGRMYGTCLGCRTCGGGCCR